MTLAIAAMVLCAAAAAAAALTGLVRRAVLRRGMLDVPNARSSHARPTPRGGGAAIVLVVASAMLAAAAAGGHALAWSALAAAAVAVAAVGWLDDRRPLSAGARFTVHALAVVLGLWAVGGLPAGDCCGMAGPAGWLVQCLAALACVWFLNLFNFMDGIDGIAGAEAVFIGVATAWLSVLADAPAALVLAWMAIAGANLGFLAWNWAPARIFMGDVGSGFLGFVIALLLVCTAAWSTLSIWTGIILIAPFLADATATLLRRMVRGERWYEAHRSHAYQLLARRWDSHARVTLLYSGINLVLVAPAAWWSWRNPQYAPAQAAALLAILMGAAWLLGAGRAESRTPAGPVSPSGR